MWYIIASICVLLLGLILCYITVKDSSYGGIDFGELAFFSFLWLFLGSIVLFILGAGVILPCTTGLDSDYLKNGEAVGYITHFREKGIIWKTWEGRYLAGVGKQTAVGGAYAFSVVDNAIVAQIRDLVGSDVRVKITYDCWLMLPYKMGSSDCLATKIEVEHDEIKMHRYGSSPAPVHGIRVRPQ